VAAGWLAARRWAWAQAALRGGGVTAWWLAAWLMMAATWGQEVRALLLPFFALLLHSVQGVLLHMHACVSCTCINAFQYRR
jgi:hypothetical protein